MEGLISLIAPFHYSLNMFSFMQSMCAHTQSCLKNASLQIIPKMQMKGDRYHSLANRIDCKELRTLRPFDTACLLHVRSVKEGKSRHKHQRLAPVHRVRQKTVSIQRNHSQSYSENPLLEHVRKALERSSRLSFIWKPDSGA